MPRKTEVAPGCTLTESTSKKSKTNKKPKKVHKTYQPGQTWRAQDLNGTPRYIDSVDVENNTIKYFPSSHGKIDATVKTRAGRNRYKDNEKGGGYTTTINEFEKWVKSHRALKTSSK